MVDVVDFNRRRFEKAGSSEDTDPVTALREALRQVETGEWPISSVVIVGIREDGNGNYIDSINAGPATSNERIGMLFRAQASLANI